MVLNTWVVETGGGRVKRVGRGGETEGLLRSTEKSQGKRKTALKNKATVSLDWGTWGAIVTRLQTTD